MALPQPSPKDDWTVETLRQHVIELFAVRDKTIAEMDRRYEQRYIGQQEAIAAALLAQDKAVQAALVSAKEAVGTANVANEKRFDSVNEFRAQQTEILAITMPRTEAEARIAQNAEKISDLSQRIAELDKRIAEMSSRTGGHADSTRNLVTIIGLVLTAVTVLVGVYLAFHK